MSSTTRTQSPKPSAPTARPPRRDLLIPMLEGSKRGIVPIRRTFLQKPRGTVGPRGANLALLARDRFALDAYLLIHAVASSSAPYTANYPAATWVQLARLDEAATFEAGRSRWSKAATKLTTLKLIERERKGNQMQYQLLDEAGSGRTYTRPTDSTEHWLRLPHSYWLDEFDAQLSQPEKLMLLIALDQPRTFTLPLNQSGSWYGISESTARRGLRGLEQNGLLLKSSSFTASPRSPTGWTEELQYTLQGPFSKDAVEKAARNSRPRGPRTKPTDHT